MAETFEWIDTDDTAWALTTAATLMQTIAGIKRMHMPPTRRDRVRVPGEPGTRLRSIAFDTRSWSLPVLISGGFGEVGLRTVLRAWEQRLNPTLGPGRIRCTSPIGDQRELICRYVEGLELDEDDTHRFPAKVITDLTFEADYPYWLATADSAALWVSGGTTSFFPIFPLRLSSSQVFSSNVITNTGDVDAWPSWYVHGPGSALVIRNITTGRTLAWSGTLASGEALTIDTRPEALSDTPKRVELQDGSNQFSLLSMYDLWPLVPGSQTIQVEMSGADAASYVTVGWRHQYLGA